MKKTITLLFILWNYLLPVFQVSGNNIGVSNVVLTGQNTTLGYTLVQFDLQWENSWRYGNVFEGKIEALFIRSGGIGYTDGTHTITFTGGGATTPATAIVTVSGTVITTINSYTSGSGYTSPATGFTGAGSGIGAVFDVHIHPWWDAAWVFVKYRVGTSDIPLSDVSNSETILTVNSTEGLRVGMPLNLTAGIGELAENTIITAIISSTEISINVTPVVNLVGATLQASPVWEHAKLYNDGNYAGSGTPSKVQIGLYDENIPFHATNNPGVGAFFYCNGNHNGVFSIITAQLRWNYLEDGIDDNDIVDVKVFAIEMVKVPDGSFYVGDGTTNFIRGHFRDGASNSPYLITSEDALILGGTVEGNLSNNDAINMQSADDFNNSITKDLPDTFPKGYAGFYCMKYDIAQYQYIEFLNTLTRVQQNTRTVTNLAVGTTVVINQYVMADNTTPQYRNGICCEGSITAYNPINFFCDLNGNGIGNENNDGQWIACNYLTFMDGSAYADWAGLRTLTELEFEKGARGSALSVIDEYAWGGSVFTQATGIANSGESNETSINAANVVVLYHPDVQGPIRVGAFAVTSSNRQKAGASFWGIMELSGNLWKRTVSVGNITGRSFTGNHGDGFLSVSGFANENNWPGLSNGEVIGDTGAGFRGGMWNTSEIWMRVSDRHFASYAPGNHSKTVGFRAGRSLPATL